MCQKSPERRKVGDTLTAEVVDRNGEDVSDNVTFQWYANDEAIEGADEETLVVDNELLGAALKVVVTAENGNTFESDPTEPVEEADGQIEITSAEATAVNEIFVALANPVDDEDTTIELYKGTNEITGFTADWADTNDSVTITTPANLTNGIYTVTLTSEEDETNADTEAFEVTGRYVKEIVIFNDVALTAATGTIADPKQTAYAYYDVYDQYGDSMRTSASITWSGSCRITANKSTGRLTLKKNTPQDWMYSEQIYVTGVYAKTGITVNKTLTVGGEQSLDSIKMAGFVKKGTTDILTKLPADFKDGTYYLIFNVLDQEGNPLTAGAANANTVTFVSDNVLVVKELTTFAPNPITIDGVEYDAVVVSPGIKVADGGEVTVTAIANKTGTKTDLNFTVGEDPVVVSFTISTPAVTVADGDSVEIPFEALDEKGNEIKNFVSLAKQETFNTLSFNASEGTLALEEQADGTAKLTWTDDAKYTGNFAAGESWALSQTTDGIDRPISLTVVVVGGDSDNEMMSVSDKRRPDAIAAVNINEVFTENAVFAFTNTHTDADGEFQFYDQYGQIIGDGEEFGEDNDFFAAAKAGVLNGTDFANYDFGIRVTYSGNNKITRTGGTGDTDAASAAKGNMWVLEEGETVTFRTAKDIKSVATGEGFKFEIARFDQTDAAYGANKADLWDSVSTSKFKGLSVVDISQVKEFSMGDLNMFYTGEIAGVTGAGTVSGAFLDNNNADAATLQAAYAARAKENGDNLGDTQQVEVTGTYNGKEVDVPAAFIKVEAGKLTTATAGGAFGEDTITKYTEGLKVQDLYDKTTSKGVSKNASDTVKVTVGQFYGSTTKAGTIKVLKNTTTAEVVGQLTDDNGATVDAANAAVANLVENYDVPVGTDTDTITAYNTAITNMKGNLAGGLTQANKERLEAAFDAVVAANELVELGGADGEVLDTITQKVQISDQARKATSIEGVADTYTVKATNTRLTNDFIKSADMLDVGDTVYVADQYGKKMVAQTNALLFKAAEIVENPEGYAENNFKASSNDTNTMAIEGAERGDVFELVLTSGSISVKTTVTLGADANANITGGVNNYRTVLLPVLEAQRKAGLN